MAKNMREGIALTADIGYDPSSNNSDGAGKHLPKLPYRLPDGTTIDVECEERYNIMEVLFGRDDDNTSVREEAYRIHKKKVFSIAALSAASSSSTDDGGEISKVSTISPKQDEHMQNKSSSSFFSSSSSSATTTTPSFI